MPTSDGLLEFKSTAHRHAIWSFKLVILFRNTLVAFVANNLKKGVKEEKKAKKVALERRRATYTTTFGEYIKNKANIPSFQGLSVWTPWRKLLTQT